MSNQCAQCGFVNRDEARFCKQCGTLLNAAATPMASAAPAVAPARRRGSWVAATALTVAILSLLLNLVLLAAVGMLVGGLLQARQAAVQALDQGIRSVEQVQREGLSFDLPISQTVQINQAIPIRRDLTIPIRTEIPINTEVSVWVTIPVIGQRAINIPVNTTVPVSLTVPIHLDTSVDLSLPVPISLTVPIRLSGDTPPLNVWLPSLRNGLEDVRRRIDGAGLSEP